MSVVDAPIPVVAPVPGVAVAERLLCGWGRTVRTRAQVLRPRSSRDVAPLLGAHAPGGIIARGAGRSYGDAAQNAGGRVIDMTGLERVLEIDSDRGLITAESGVTVATLLRSLAGHGLTLPVVPGTRHVTLGGALASDVHGKNHCRDGSLAAHVSSLTLCPPDGEPIEVSPESDPELFASTLGGLGLTGVVLSATIRAQPLPSPWFSLDTDRTDGIDQTLALMDGEPTHRHAVAWVDLLAGGAQLGRSVLSRADPWPTQEEPPRGRGGRGRADGEPVRGRGSADGAGVTPVLTDRPRVRVPRGVPSVALSATGQRAFNALRWRLAPRRARSQPLSMAGHYFPLDALSDWNRLYGPDGLIQYQFVVPRGREQTLSRALELIVGRRLPAYLAVLKRLGPGSGGPLSFPLEGWTLAVDLPAQAPGLRAALDQLDRLVADSGGRVYLTKDVRLRRELLADMYPELDRFRAVRSRVDPDRILQSDLSRRLGLDG